MIQVLYQPRYYRVTVRGHARSGEPGRDLVCAAVSALAVTLTENVSAMERAGQLRAVTLDLRPGLAEVQCQPRAGSRLAAKTVLNAVCLGLERLAREYPAYLRYEARG